MISVLLVADQALLVELLRRWLTRDPAIHVVGAVSELRALATIPARRVDVVLMDYVLPDGSGVDGIRAVKHRWPGARVVMLTAWDDETVMLDAVQAGADRFLSKDVPPDKVLRAVRIAHAGGVLLPTAVLARLGGS